MELTIGYLVLTKQHDGSWQDDWDGCVYDNERDAAEAERCAGDALGADSRLAAVVWKDQLVPLGDIPIDGTWEILGGGCDDEPSFVRFTPKHHLATVRRDSGVMVVARSVEGHLSVSRKRCNCYPDPRDHEADCPRREGTDGE